GHIGDIPKTTHFDNGQISKVRLATNSTYTNQQNEKVTETEWHTLVFRGKYSVAAEKYFTKGMKISVEGSLRTREYELNNEKKYITEVLVSSFTFEDSAPNAS
ncbi:MAG: single-stranded DNA-binding protein, partial [Algoriella sp.]